jgi:hypothetical protein
MVGCKNLDAAAAGDDKTSGSVKLNILERKPIKLSL